MSRLTTLHPRSLTAAAFLVLRNENAYTVAPPFRAARAGLKPGASSVYILGGQAAYAGNHPAPGALPLLNQAGSPEKLPSSDEEGRRRRRRGGVEPQM